VLQFGGIGLLYPEVSNSNYVVSCDGGGCDLCMVC
jgi:hypothetical protein